MGCYFLKGPPDWGSVSIEGLIHNICQATSPSSSSSTLGGLRLAGTTKIGCQDCQSVGQSVAGPCSAFCYMQEVFFQQKDGIGLLKSGEVEEGW